MTGNPVIDAISAGHVARGNPSVCDLCEVLWPCEPIIEARLLLATRATLNQRSKPKRSSYYLY